MLFVLEPQYDSLVCFSVLYVLLLLCRGGQIFDRFRGQDKKLLKSLDVGYICDLMVEKKKVKFGMK